MNKKKSNEDLKEKIKSHDNKTDLLILRLTNLNIILVILFIAKQTIDLILVNHVVKTISTVLILSIILACFIIVVKIVVETIKMSREIKRSKKFTNKTKGRSE